MSGPYSVHNIDAGYPCPAAGELSRRYLLRSSRPRPRLVDSESFPQPSDIAPKSVHAVQAMLGSHIYSIIPGIPHTPLTLWSMWIKLLIIKISFNSISIWKHVFDLGSCSYCLIHDLVWLLCQDPAGIRNSKTQNLNNQLDLRYALELMIVSVFPTLDHCSLSVWPRICRLDTSVSCNPLTPSLPHTWAHTILIISLLRPGSLSTCQTCILILSDDA